MTTPSSSVLGQNRWRRGGGFRVSLDHLRDGLGPALGAFQQVFAFSHAKTKPWGVASRKCLGYIYCSHCRLAQSVEQLTVNQRVVGSSPTAAATLLNLKRALYSLTSPDRLCFVGTADSVRLPYKKRSNVKMVPKIRRASVCSHQSILCINRHGYSISLSTYQIQPVGFVSLFSLDYMAGIILFARCEEPCYT